MIKWEIDWAEWEAAAGAQLPIVMKTCLVIAGTTGKLHDVLCMTCKGYNDYDSVKSTVVNYIKTKSVCTGGKTSKSNKPWNTDPNAMDTSEPAINDFGYKKGKVRGQV